MKAIILKYDEERHDYIVEDLDDDRHLVIKESQLETMLSILIYLRCSIPEPTMLQNVTQDSSSWMVLESTRDIPLGLAC